MGKNNKFDIVLLTDFGNSHYSGILHGVLRDYNPDATVIDLTHNISPFNVVEASYILYSSYKYFRKGSIFVCVVDPGVGSERKVIFGEYDGYYFVAPDNGLLSPFLKEKTFMVFTNTSLLKKPVSSNTFHGRDIFAPVGALISLGYDLNILGEPYKEAIIRAWWELSILDEHTYQGIVLHIDRFGNAITNIPCKKLPYIEEIRMKGITIRDKHSSFHNAEYNTPFMFCGSSNYIEIGIKEKNFSSTYHISVLTPLLLVVK